MKIKYHYIVRHQDICERIKKGCLTFMSNLQTYYPFKLDFQKSVPTYRRQVVNPRHQTWQGQSVAKPGTPLQNIPVGNVNTT